MVGCGAVVDPPPEQLSNVLDSSNATQLNEYRAGSIARTGFGDQFTIFPGERRVTWFTTAFARMGDQKVFELKLRADHWPRSTGWTHFLMIQQSHRAFGSGCAKPGNAESLIVRIWLQFRRNRWMLDVRGGETPEAGVQILKRYDLGAVAVKRVLALRFDIRFHATDGHIAVWRQGLKIADVRTPVGFRYLCDGTTDVSNDELQVQHGIYRDPENPTLVLSSSGLHFFDAAIAADG